MAERILIVEDEAQLARMLELELCYEGYEVTLAADGRDGLELALNEKLDLLLLDIMLPGLSGIEVLRRLRRDGRNVPVILLTARDNVADKVAGLDAGANDYITKPFDIEELLARIRCALRTPFPIGQGGETADLLTSGPVTLERSRRRVEVNGQEVALTRREFDLLRCLMEHKGTVLSRSTLLTTVWGYDYAGETNTVDVYVRFLRNKIDHVYGLQLIETVRGVGYVIRE
ncbi:MAG: response regulator transcription factor [Clostridiales bacterium]|nr:response regulator transcription factor [Clostridiales bacterium]MCD8368497.1 response regulator transcription factor [Clostridiales bacterium]